MTIVLTEIIREDGVSDLTPYKAKAHFARVMIFSTNIRVSFALATVVLILLCFRRAVESAMSSALR